ncbi:MAG: ribosome biogenesis GTPase Der [Spirochaetia bacterium]|nr:ribosome biogenesis GTPase Der [Spirochaetia bacterium]
MKKKKQKPDFSKPKPVKSVSIQEEQETFQENTQTQQQEQTEQSDDSIKSQRKSKTDKFFPDKTYNNLPLIVIAGRPNVGKSTLFNALTHTKRAITDPTPGVTRDPVEGTCFIAGKPVHLMDTGGYKLTRDFTSRESEMDDLVVEKTVEMLVKADRILLLLDATEITAEDEELIARLRPYWNKLMAAVNKTEGGKNVNLAYNYAKFGFKDLIFISASHGDNLPELEEKLINGIDFSAVTEGAEEEKPVRIAILGKPNTGKSTLSNALTHTQASIVSDYAGTTRDVVEGSFRYNNKDIQILDTAGIRRKAKVTENVEYYSVNRAIKTLDECDIAFIMIDAKEGLAEQDKKITSLAFERGRGVIFVLNKWDLMEDQSNKAIRATKDWIQTMFGHMNWAPIVTISAKNADGIKNLMNTALTVYSQLNRKIDTATLNIALKDWLFKYPPPATKSIHFKVRYITQTSINPVNFLIFATRPDNVPQSYVAYLKNRIREDLGFDQIPVQIEMKASRQKWQERGMETDDKKVR